MQRALTVQPQGWFEAPFDEEWRSSCELDDHPVGATTRWRPTRQPSPVDFSHLENALEMPVHDDIKTYYGRYWAGAIEARSIEGHVSLIQLWNYDDYERLIGNLVGHALAKRRAKEDFTVFFATTDPDTEYFLSIDNVTGRVLLEEPGKAPIKEVDQSVADFLGRLTPLDTPPAMY